MRRLLAAAVAAVAIAGCGDDGEFAVGECTTANPNELVSFDVEVVDCDDREARSRIRSRRPRSEDCGPREGALEDPEDSDYTFCYGPK
jgi:hypothetical protein